MFLSQGRGIFFSLHTTFANFDMGCFWLQLVASFRVQPVILLVHLTLLPNTRHRKYSCRQNRYLAAVLILAQSSFYRRIGQSVVESNKRLLFLAPATLLLLGPLEFLSYFHVSLQSFPRLVASFSTTLSTWFAFQKLSTSLFLAPSSL